MYKLSVKKQQKIVISQQTSGGVEQSECVGVRGLKVLSSSLNKNFNGIAQKRLSSCWCMEKTHLQIK